MRELPRKALPKPSPSPEPEKELEQKVVVIAPAAVPVPAPTPKALGDTAEPRKWYGWVALTLMRAYLNAELTLIALPVNLNGRAERFINLNGRAG